MITGVQDPTTLVCKGSGCSRGPREEAAVLRLLRCVQRQRPHGALVHWSWQPCRSRSPPLPTTSLSMGLKVRTTSASCPVACTRTAERRTDAWWPPIRRWRAADVVPPPAARLRQRLHYRPHSIGPLPLSLLPPLQEDFDKAAEEAKAVRGPGADSCSRCSAMRLQSALPSAAWSFCLTLGLPPPPPFPAVARQHQQRRQAVAVRPFQAGHRRGQHHKYAGRGWGLG